jgi:hypothetical protein
MENSGAREVPMPDRAKYDMDFRPGSYWDLSDVVTTMLSRIKGEARKQRARHMLETGKSSEYQNFLLAEKLTEQEREAVTRIHPTLMGGEYLPDYNDSEVEIARVALDSTTADVISIRAWREGGRIRYRIVDEYESTFVHEPTSSERSLSMAELVGLIDGARHEGWAENDPPYTGLTRAFRDSSLDPTAPCVEDAEDLVDFVTVESDFYPQLRAWFEEEAQEWLANIREKCRKDDEEGG